MPLPSDPPLDLVTPVQVAAQSKEWVCGRSIAGIVGSNPPPGGMNVCCVNVVCCQVLRRADPSYGGVLPNVVCQSMTSKPQQ